MKALTAALALLLLAAAGTCRAEIASPLDDPSDVSPVELIDASLGPLSELAARAGLSIEDAAALVAARARSHTTAGGAASDMAPRGLISDLVGDLKESVPEAVSDAIDWGKSQISYYKCVAKCIFKYKAKGAGDRVNNMVGCVLQCKF